MGDVFEVEGARVRSFDLVKAILLSIVTLGVYYLILTYRNTKDLQATRLKPLSSWEVLFWLGILIGPLHWVLWAYNLQTLAIVRQHGEMADDPMGILAVVLGIVAGPVGQILWAVHVNATLEACGTRA